MVAGYTKCVQADSDDKKGIIYNYDVEKQVPQLPACAGKELKDDGAAYYDAESPPDYYEKDPLQGPLNDCTEGGLSRNSTIGSFSSQSTGDFSDDDDVTDTESGLVWSELSRCGQIKRVLKCLGKAIALPLLLYIFICSLDFLSSAFRILGGKTAGGVFTNNALLGNPVAGLMIGILATVLVQSSSTSTSIIVTMVASGIISVRPAIPIIMGANIGTSVTNTFVSMAQSGDRREFRRAFAGATVHDMFNWLTVIILLPLEWATGYLYHLTKAIVDACNLQESYSGGKQELLKAITKPFTSLVVKIDKNVIEKIAEGHMEYMNKSIIKKYCVFEEVEVVQNVTDGLNSTGNVTQEIVTEKVPLEKCFSLLSYLDLNENLAGVILLVFSLIVLCSCLIFMVKLLNSILQGSIAKLIRKTLNSDFPHPWSWLTGYVAMIVGMIMTVLVQSSSVFTSALTPLVGIGMIKLERMYPLTLGSNIGTTGTGLLAAMAASSDKLPIALQIAFCHLFFNISGIILFYPVPAMRKLPLKAARFLGSITAEYRWFAIAYLLFMFILLPSSVFLVSLAGFIPSVVAASIIIPTLLFIIIVNILQSKRPKCLPKTLRNWEFLPKFLRSLQPYDCLIMKVVSGLKRCCPCCVKCCTRKQRKPDHRKPPAIASKIIKDTHMPLKVSPAASAASSRLLLDTSNFERVSVI